MYDIGVTNSLLYMISTERLQKDQKEREREEKERQTRRRTKERQVQTNRHLLDKKAEEIVPNNSILQSIHSLSISSETYSRSYLRTLRKRIYSYGQQPVGL